MAEDPRTCPHHQERANYETRQDRPAEVQKFAGLFQAMVPSEVVIKPFQKLLSSKTERTTKPSTTTKNTKKTKALLEKFIVQKHWRRQSLVWSCPHNLEALREKVQFLGPKPSNELFGTRDLLSQDMRSMTRIYIKRKMATNKVKDAFHEAANVLKRAFAHLETESAGSMLPPGVMKLMKSLRRLLSRYIEGPCLSYPLFGCLRPQVCVCDC